jgi:hypothetical protein
METSANQRFNNIFGDIVRRNVEMAWQFRTDNTVPANYIPANVLLLGKDRRIRSGIFQ